MKQSIRVQILENFTIFFDSEVDSVDKVPVLDGHYLVVKVHKDDFFGKILNAQFALSVIHDIVNSVERSGFDLFCSEVDFQAPQDKALLLFLGFLEEDIDDVIDRGRNSQQLLGFVNRIAFIKLLLDQTQSLDVINFEATRIEDSKHCILQKSDKPHSFLHRELYEESWRILGFYTVGVEADGRLAKNQKEVFYFREVLLLLSTEMLSMGPFKERDQ